jgi:hypothetical protein
MSMKHILDINKSVNICQVGNQVLQCLQIFLWTGMHGKLMINFQPFQS